MKRKMRKPALAMIAIALLLSFGLVATAATLNVPVPYGTIKAALADASEGDTIVVATGYAGEGAGNFPIQVQKKNITIRADGTVTVTGEAGKAVFVVGAAWYFNQATSLYEDVTITGVTIDGFTILGGEIGVLVKEANGIKIKNNYIGATAGGSPYEGIRLLKASGCKIENNTIIGTAGIGIFLEESSNNDLLGNTVTGAALGLFIFESNSNTVTGDTYNGNDNGGVVLNDSDGNILSGLLVQSNTGWGVRFVFADNNELLLSMIGDEKATDEINKGNTVGGVELLGSQGNLVEGNIVFNNGTSNDDSDDAQIVITFGDKAIFTTPVFGVDDDEGYNDLGDLSGFVNEKFRIYDKLDLLWWWIAELDLELVELRQKTASAIGMCVEGVQTDSLTAYIDTIIYEKHYIMNPQTDTKTGLQEGVLISEFWNDDLLAEEHRPAAMENTAYNFTLGGTFSFNGSYHPDEVTVTGTELDFYEDGAYDDFGLIREGTITPPNEGYADDDEISWDKMRIIDILIRAIGNEIWNNFGDGEFDSLKEKLVDLLAKGLIEEQDKIDLDEKLDAALGFLAQIDEVVLVLKGKLAGTENNDVDYFLEQAKGALDGTAGGYDTAKQHLLTAKQLIEETIAAKLAIYLLIADIRYKLCLVDLELPPFPEINSDLVGKKEKPFREITNGGEIDTMKGDIVDGLNGDIPAAMDILAAVYPLRDPMEWTPGDITVDHEGLRASTGNTIASNLITSDLLGDEQIGIVIECDDNMIVNNSITNEKVLPIDTELGYGEFHRLDIAIYLLSNENTLAYNAIEWVNKGIIRGGTWKRDDVQVEYVFAKLVIAANWPEPGLFRTGCVNPNTLLTTEYGADHFVSRPVVWVPVLSVKSAPVIGIGFDDSQRVKRNRLALNFFEYVGTSIDIVDAESNMIDENLFYNCANGILFRAPAIGVDVPGDPDPIHKYDTGGAGPNIVLEKNDYYSGVAIHNDSNLAVGASSGYTPPEGTVGHAAVFGLVTPPAAPVPNSYDNFGTNVKYVMLAITKYAPDYDSAVILPPNMSSFYGTVELPVRGFDLENPDIGKPQHPSVIFDTPQPVCWSETFPAGWNLVSIPVVALDKNPEAVFGDDVPFLYLFKYDPASGNYVQYNPPTTTFDVEPIEGYWIYLMTETTLDVCGTVPTEDVESVLGDAGWQMISTPTICVYWQLIEFKLGEETKNLADAVAAGWVRPFFYPYDPATGNYEVLGASATDLICPWPGYWILTEVDGLTLVLPIKYMLDNPPVPPMSLRLQSIGVAGDTPPPPPPLPGVANPDDLVIVNTPNPIRDVHTTVFKVMGGFVDAVRVRIYDLSGQLVFEDENPGNELAWHTENLAGEYLANGAYLYRVEVKVGDQWIITKVQKLVIYR